MSRFFKQEGDLDSDPEESEEELLSSGDDEAPAPSAKPAAAPARGISESESADDDESDSDGDQAQPQKKVSRSRPDQEDDSEDEDDVKRIVKSAKDKRLEEMEGTGKAIDNALKINHWVAISNEFDKLVRLAQRQTNVAEQIPDFYIHTLSGLEDSLNSAMAKEKEATKKMNLSNSRAFNGTKQKLKQKKAVKVDVEEEGDEGGDFTSVGKGGKALGFTPDSVFKNLQTVQESRGKKVNTDRAVQNNILERFLEVANTSYQRIRVLLALISSRFDYNSSVSTHLPISLWLASQREVDQLIAIVMGDPSYSVQEITEDYDEFVERSPADEKDGVVRIHGSIISFVDRLDDEFTKSLQNIDPHRTEYVDRLKDEKGLYESICQAQAFYETTNQLDPLA
ncbi:eukaryotic translation initiation factor 3 subunit 8 N-terminus-domain-containing protein [Gautieria morchelliformis]|nr:eukaryotic translation initiation factor 3 subunit 8 N-terminus-domain-containing protein [Gautieria morchelliformis]